MGPDLRREGTTHGAGPRTFLDEVMARALDRPVPSSAMGGAHRRGPRATCTRHVPPDPRTPLRRCPRRRSDRVRGHLLAFAVVSGHTRRRPRPRPARPRPSGHRRGRHGARRDRGAEREGDRGVAAPGFTAPGPARSPPGDRSADRRGRRIGAHRGARGGQGRAARRIMSSLSPRWYRLHPRWRVRGRGRDGAAAHQRPEAGLPERGRRVRQRPAGLLDAGSRRLVPQCRQRRQGRRARAVVQ